jgi:adenylate cyclase
VGIVVGEKTRQAVPDIVFRELDCVQVKGKNQPVSVYEPIGLETDVSPEKMEELKFFEEVLALYRSMSWDKAETLLLGLQKNHPDEYLYQLYLDRIRRLRQDPPGSGWNGVYTFTTK